MTAFSAASPESTISRFDFAAAFERVLDESGDVLLVFDDEDARFWHDTNDATFARFPPGDARVNSGLRKGPGGPGGPGLADLAGQSGRQVRQVGLRRKRMKAVVIGESSGASMEQIVAVYPRHKAVVDEFVARGEVIGIGPFEDRGNMAIFRTRGAAEEFVARDPFNLEGLVKRYVIREWNDSMLK